MAETLEVDCTRLSDFTLLGFIALITFGERHEVLLAQFSPATCLFFSLGLHILLRISDSVFPHELRPSVPFYVETNCKVANFTANSVVSNRKFKIHSVLNFT